VSPTTTSGRLGGEKLKLCTVTIHFVALADPDKVIIKPKTSAENKNVYFFITSGIIFI
jgi:hypothetical protein